jgi:Flp pilus assembly protein TadD
MQSTRRWCRAIAIGRNAFRGGNFATAEQAFQAALAAAETDKRRSTAWFALGLTALRLGKPADARARAEQSLALLPDNAQAKELLAAAMSAAVDDLPKAATGASEPQQAPQQAPKQP